LRRARKTTSSWREENVGETTPGPVNCGLDGFAGLWADLRPTGYF